jgi:hypothetical protein
MVSLAEQSFSMFPSQHDADDFGRYPETSHSSGAFGPVPNTGPMDMTIGGEVLGAFPRSGHEVYTMPTTVGFEPSLYAEASHYVLNGQHSPGMYADDGDMRMPSSSLSTASATSSAIGSPQSNHGQGAAVGEWSAQGLGVRPSIVGNDYMSAPEYGYTGTGMEDITFDMSTAKGFVGEFPRFLHDSLYPPIFAFLFYFAYFTPFHHHSLPSHTLGSEVRRALSSRPPLNANGTTLELDQAKTWRICVLEGGSSAFAGGTALCELFGRQQAPRLDQ